MPTGRTKTKTSTKTAPKKKAKKASVKAAPPKKATPKKAPARKAPARKATKAAAKAPRIAAPGRVVVQNVNVPGYTSTVEAPRYEAMKKALLRVLPAKAPGLTQAEMFASVRPHLPDALFPGGAKSGWWVKCVHLDLEAKGEVVRDAVKKPIRWRRTWPGDARVPRY